MAIWSSLALASCCLIGQAEEAISSTAPAPLPAPVKTQAEIIKAEIGEPAKPTKESAADARLVSFEVCWTITPPNWRERLSEARFTEIDREGEAVVWTMDADAVKSFVRIAVASPFGEFVQAPRLITPENVAAEILQPQTLPLNLAVEYTGTTGMPRETTISKLGTVDLKRRVRLSANYCDPSSPACAPYWRIEGVIERTDIGRTIHSIASKDQPVTVSVPRVVRYGIEGNWRLEQDQALVVQLGRGSSSRDLNPDLSFSAPKSDVLVVIQPKLAAAAPAPTSAEEIAKPAPIASALRDLNVAQTSAPRPTAQSAPETIKAKMVSSTYYVGDIVDAEMLAELSETMARTVQPDFWNAIPNAEGKRPNLDPSKGTIMPFFLNNTLIVRATPEVHDKLSKKLDFFRMARLNEISIENLLKSLQKP